MEYRAPSQGSGTEGCAQTEVSEIVGELYDMRRGELSS